MFISQQQSNDKNEQETFLTSNFALWLFPLRP